MLRRTAPLFILIALLASHVLAGGVSIRGYFTVGFKDKPYQEQMVKKVIAGWKAPKKLPPAGKKTVYILKINRQGQIASSALHLSSGSRIFDEAALSCLKACQPYGALPVSFHYPYMEVHYHFEVVK